MTQFCPGIARNDPACPQIVNTFYYGSLWTILGFCVSFLAIQGNLGPWGKLRNILGHFLGEFLQLHWSSNKWTRMLKWLRSSNGTPHGPGKTPGQVENNNYSIHYVDLLFISHYERPCRIFFFTSVFLSVFPVGPIGSYGAFVFISLKLNNLHNA